MNTNLYLSESFNSRNTQNILYILLQEWVKWKAKEIICNIWNLWELDTLIKQDNNIWYFFDTIRDTIISNIKIWQSKIDSKEYFINIDDNTIIWNWFEKIIDIFEKDWQIIFQALDYSIDWYYAYYDYNTWNIISRKDDRKMNNFIPLQSQICKSNSSDAEICEK